ncbi:multidrug effflux MFS transporter [Chelativorans sp. Marseille-P2723]|uniref:multidrug effflux MFS transporter n=1 Tax=Chelativorans sp. Marseille-P2723 TaxID=2709133 RepID=UPI0015709A4E|nr:multidrug effflux MFS transporter [Chelativorans sp. Marseille-P2723]
MDISAKTAQAAAPLMSARRVGIIGAMLVAIGPVSLALYTPAMPQIVQAFGTTDAAVKLTVSLYFAGFAFSQLICGPLSDALGRRPVTFAFMVIYAVASFLAVLAPSVDILIIARFLQGFGGAVGVAVSRALVRDLFTHEQSARIMNLMGIILAAGPALAPTLGGVTMELAGWHAIFVIMFVWGLVVILLVHLFMRETITPDLSRMRPGSLLRSYGALMKSPYFITSSMVVAGAIGAMYTQATLLPFILMDRVGLSPAAFGIGMIMQSGTYFLGSLSMGFLLRRFSAFRLVPAGLFFIALGSGMLCFILNSGPPTFLRVMVPVAVYVFGVAYVMPAMMTAALAPFPHMAGAASALSGFAQMASGLIGGIVAALISDPVFALSLVIPGLGTIAIVSWLIWRTLPEPALAGQVTHTE